MNNLVFFCSQVKYFSQLIGFCCFLYFCEMMHKTGIALLLIYCCADFLPASFRAELCKLPWLVEHFFEHRSGSSELSFLDFIQLHYGEKYQAHESAHNHSKLPGKSGADHAHFMACGCNFSALPAALAFSLRMPVNMHRALVPADKQLHSSNLSSGIWQPPRQV